VVVFIRNSPQGFTLGDFYPEVSSGLSKNGKFFSATRIQLEIDTSGSHNSIE
jgi:hypothetical protein